MSDDTGESGGTKNYIDPDELEREIVLWKETGEMSERLGELFLQLVTNVSVNSRFRNYTNHWKDEMIQRALLHLCSYAHNFNPDHPRANVFAYCTRIAWNGFIQVIKREKRHSQLKKDLYEASQHISHSGLFQQRFQESQDQDMEWSNDDDE